MFHVGLDVHLRKIVMCILDAYGKVYKEASFSDVKALLAVLGALPQELAVCYEASCGYGALYDRLKRLTNVRRIEVAHPGQLRLIFRSKRKNDRVDARKLAMLLFLDQVPQVHVPVQDVRDWRAAIEFRRAQVDRRTAIKNQLRALLRTHGEAGPYRKALWTKSGRAWLEAFELPTPLARLQRTVLLSELDGVGGQIQALEKELNAIGRKHAGVCLLRTIPGVGPRTSEAFVAYVDEVKRFGRSKQVGSYFGLVPSQDQSGASNRLGHITRQGPATVRKLLTEAAWQGVQRSPEIRARFERIAAKDAGRRKIALVATAHWLVRVMFSMLRSGETSRFTRFEKPESGKKRKAKEPKTTAVSPPAASQTAASQTAASQTAASQPAASQPAAA